MKVVSIAAEDHFDLVTLSDLKRTFLRTNDPRWYKCVDGKVPYDLPMDDKDSAQLEAAYQEFIKKEAQDGV